MVAVRASNESSTTFQGAEIKGLLPAVDARTVDKPFILAGQNFLVDVKGPYSAFTSRILTYNQIVSPQHIYSFEMNGDEYQCTPGAILKFDTNTSRFFPVYTFQDAGSSWPWSVATCGENYFICRQGLGVIEFNPATSVWTKLVAGIPNDPRYVTQTFGRLIVVGATQTVWSALDDGTDFTPSPTTGAGFQGHSIVSGVAKGLVCKQINDGVIVYTDGGCYIGQVSLLGNSPFRWFVLDRARFPLNPHCFADIDSTTHVILEQKGLYQTSDGNYSEFDPLFSEFLRTQVFPIHDLSGLIIDNFRLSYDQNNKFFGIHINNTDSNTALYDIAYVKYIPRQEWGRMDRQHYAWTGLTFTSGPQHGRQTGYINEHGYFCKFITDAFVEVSPGDDHIYEFHPSFEIPYRQQNIQNGQIINMCASEMKITSYSEAIFTNNLNPQPGVFFINETPYYSPSPLNTSPQPEVADLINITVDDWMQDATATFDWGTGIPDDTAEDWSTGGLGVLCGSVMAMTSAADLFTIQPYIPQSNPLNSFITVGLIRFEEAKYNDEIGLVTNITFGVDAIPGSPDFDDWQNDNSNGQDIIEDWSSITAAAEDWGVNLTLATSFDATITGFYDDGQTVFQEEIPQLEVLATGQQIVGGSQYYVCSTNGCYHAVTLSATSQGQSFRLKLLELAGFMAGRL